MKNYNKLFLVAIIVLFFVLYSEIALAIPEFSNIPDENTPVVSDYSIVLTIARDEVNNITYIGGNFTSINGQARRNLAAFDSNGNLTSWNPIVNMDAGINNLVISGNTIYASGYFATINGQARNRLAAFDSNGNLTSWNPSANHVVDILAVSGNTIYVGGYFTIINGQARDHLAAIDFNGNLTSWNPNIIPADGRLSALAVSGNTIYVGGSFNSINGQARRNLAAFDSNGNLTSWNPIVNMDAGINILAVSENTIYVGGYFNVINGQARNSLAAFDSNGNLTSWNPDAYGGLGFVEALAVIGDTIYAGGNFTIINGQARDHLAAIDSNGNLTSWNPDVGPSLTFIYDLAVSGNNTLYVAGTFNNIGDRAIRSFAIFSKGGTPPILPLASSNLTTTALSDTEIKLTWQDNSNNETGFKIYRSASPFVQIATVSANTTSYIDKGLTPNKTYSYQVFAYNDQGNSAVPTNTASVTTKETPVVCTNECSVLSQVQCSDSTNKQICGNYDSDTCLEWGSSQLCTGDVTTCGYGVCSDSQTAYNWRCSSGGCVYSCKEEMSCVPELPSPTTLNISLSANPNSGISSLSNVSLTANVSGTAQGNINYTFYCNRNDSGTNITTPYDVKGDNVSSLIKTASNLCDYSQPGTYVAKVIAERGGKQAESRVSIVINSPAPTPQPITSMPTPTPVTPTTPTPTPTPTPITETQKQVQIQVLETQIQSLQQQIVQLITQLIQLLQEQLQVLSKI